jgi:hypothetical protein
MTRDCVFFDFNLPSGKIFIFYEVEMNCGEISRYLVQEYNKFVGMK